jgi:Mrp family chromosome partitioning ATPase
MDWRQRDEPEEPTASLSMHPKESPSNNGRQLTEPVVLDACRRAMFQLDVDWPMSIGVVSADRGEGRTTTAIGFAAIHSRDYVRRTLLLELDFVRPALAARYGLANIGLADVLTGKVKIDDAIQLLDDDLFVLTAGRTRNLSPQTLCVEFLRTDLQAQLRRRFSMLVGDLPPILESSGATALAGAFDKLLLVVRAARTATARARDAAGALPTKPAVLLNGTRSNLPRWLSQLTRR